MIQAASRPAGRGSMQGLYKLEGVCLWEGAGQGGLAKEEEGALLSQGIFREGNGKDAIVQTASSSLVGRGSPHGRPPGEGRETPDQWVEVTFLAVAETAGRPGSMSLSTGGTSDRLGPVVFLFDIEYTLRVLHTPPCNTSQNTSISSNQPTFLKILLIFACTGFSLVAVGGDYSSLPCAGVSLWSMGFSGCGSRTLGPRLSH